MPEPRALPELTRGLRHLASPEAVLSSDHGVLFGPLLDARRLAERVTGESARLSALDAGRLRSALVAAVETLAERRHDAAPDRRALTAELLELGAPVWRALEGSAAAAAVVHDADHDAARDAAWAAWVASLVAVFEAVDDWWERMLPALADPRGRSGRLWRRWMRRSTGFVLAAATAAPALAAQHVTVRIPGVPAESLLRRQFDVVARDGEATLVVAGPDDRARLARLGWTGTPVLAPGADPRQALGQLAPTTPRVYRPFDDRTRGIRAYLDSLARATGRLVVDSIGASTEGRPLLAVKVGVTGESSARPNVLFMATYHAREWAATEVALRLIRLLATATDPRTDSLRRTRDIWVIPVANPDGYQYTFTADRLWRKTRSPQGQGAVGVDLNRNHRANWGYDDWGSSGSPTSEIYRGPRPASEPETQAIERFHERFPPVMSLSYHTFAGQLLYPPGFREGELPGDLDVYRTFAGTNADVAVKDRLPGSPLTQYASLTGWMLYPTNGEYSDWAAQRFGTIAITPEMTSGYDGQRRYYGFEFPDDETLLEQLFQDNLPFALDLIEGASDPAAYRSPTTGRQAMQVALESVSPELRVRVPADVAGTAAIRADGLVVPLQVDTVGGGRYRRRLRGRAGRPTRVEVRSGVAVASWRVLLRSGAEPGETTGWTPLGFEAGAPGPALVGENVWWTARGGELRFPPVVVPAESDSISVLFWARYTGDPFSPVPGARLRASLDGGGSWRDIGRLMGNASVWYPEDVTLGGVRGRTVTLSMLSEGLPLRLDEIHVVAHAPAGTTPVPVAARLAPSENPVRGTTVHLAWPWPARAGDLFVYDWGGRLVWRTAVAGTATAIPWDVAAAAVPNGVYLVLARAAGETQRLKLMVARDSR